MIARLSLKAQLVFLSMTVATIALLVAGITLTVRDRAVARDNLQREMMVVASLVGNRSSAALVFGDPAGVNENLLVLSAHPLTGMACIVDANGKEVATYTRVPSTLARCALTQPLMAEYSTSAGTALQVQVPVFSGEILAGALLLQSMPYPLAERFNSQIVSLVISLAAALLIVVPIALRLRRTITRPLDEVRKVANAVVDSGDYSLRAPDLGLHEVGKLARAFNAMLETIAGQNAALATNEAEMRTLNAELEQRVAGRTLELEVTNRSLHQAVDRLQQAQSELVQREKLASLGSLVAGVAHELNTPLGNSVVVGSTLLHEIEEMHALVTEGSPLSRSGMKSKAERMRDGAVLLIRNLERSSELIRHFKQVAVDQTSEQRRGFDLVALVGEIVETVRPQFKHTPHRIDNEVVESLEFDSYPGPLGQVLTNLLLNAHLHGFDDDSPGVVRIRAQRLGGTMVRLTVEDNGRGIPPENLSHVFDPFFTTKLGQGGSGLGLHIVYNIVTLTLGGAISVRSDQGAVFELDLPLTAPQTTHDTGRAMAATQRTNAAGG